MHSNHTGVENVECLSLVKFDCTHTRAHIKRLDDRNELFNLFFFVVPWQDIEAAEKSNTECER